MLNQPLGNSRVSDQPAQSMDYRRGWKASTGQASPFHAPAQETGSVSRYDRSGRQPLGLAFSVMKFDLTTAYEDDCAFDGRGMAAGWLRGHIAWIVDDRAFDSRAAYQRRCVSFGRGLVIFP